MITALLLYLFRRLRRSTARPPVLKRLKCTPVLILLLVCGLGTAQPDVRTFRVDRKGKSLGYIEIKKETRLGEEHFTLTSKIWARLVMNFKVESGEKAIFRNGNLVYSSVYRTLNNKVKSDLEVVRRPVGYEYIDSQGRRNLSIDAIHCNLHQLYFKEPGKEIRQVYWDNQTQLVDLTSLGNGKYRVDFSNGDYNIFWYTNGKCARVEVFKSLYYLELIPGDHVS